MAGINTDIDNLKRDIEKTQQALKNLYQNLGETGAQYHRAIDCPQSNELFKLLCRCKEDYDDVNARLSGIRQAVKNLDSTDREILKTNVSIRNLDSKKSTLIASLGAVACELASQGKLPKSLEGCLESAKIFDDEMQKRIAKRDSMDSSKPAFLIAIADRRVEAMKKNINSVFYETGKRLLASVDIGDLKNERAVAIIEELEMLKKSRKNYKRIIQSNVETRTSAQNSLREDNKSLREVLLSQAEIKKKLDSYYTQYGAVIAKEMDRWLDSSAPDELKDICGRIKIENRRLAKQNLNLEYLQAQKDIELSENHKSQLSVQLSHLLEQRANIDKQIKEVKNKINSLEQNLFDLQEKQSNVTKKAIKNAE